MSMEWLEGIVGACQTLAMSDTYIGGLRSSRSSGGQSSGMLYVCAKNERQRCHALIQSMLAGLNLMHKCTAVRQLPHRGDSSKCTFCKARSIFSRNVAYSGCGMWRNDALPHPFHHRERGPKAAAGYTHPADECVHPRLVLLP